MKPVFVDTSGFYAFLDRADPFHAQARERRLSLTDCVSFEAMTARGCSEALADDEHFRKLGYALPAA